MFSLGLLSIRREEEDVRKAQGKASEQLCAVATSFGSVHSWCSMVYEYGINLRTTKGYTTALCLYPSRIWGLFLELVSTMKKTYYGINF